MLKTALIIVPDENGDYSQSLQIATEYNRLTYGLFHENSLTSVFTIDGDKLLDAGTQNMRVPKVKQIQKLPESEPHGVFKVLLERKKTCSFSCGRVVLIFPNTHFLPPFDTNIPADEVFTIAQNIFKGSEKRFDKFCVDVVVLRQAEPVHMESENGLYHLYCIENYMKTYLVVETQMKLSKLTTNKHMLVALFKNTGPQLDITIDEEKQHMVEYFDKNDIFPIVVKSTNVVVTSETPGVTEKFEKDFDTCVLVFNQEYMISKSKTAGLRISEVHQLPSFHPSYLFDCPPAETNDDVVEALSRVLRLYPSQPGFAIKRDGENPIAKTFLQLMDSEEFSIKFKIISGNNLVAISNEFCTAFIKQNPDNKDYSTAKDVLNLLYAFAQKRDTSFFPKSLRENVSYKDCYIYLLELYNEFAKAFTFKNEQKAAICSYIDVILDKVRQMN